MLERLKLIESTVLNGLKDFQLATAKRVFELYKQGQKRVLVADEVGLGKTLIAKGVIAQTARYHYEELKDDLFKVVYVCSNQVIANQNLNKLKICEDITVDGVTDTRLSMQHLKIYEQESDNVVLNRYIQLIPLTPATSFYMTSGTGSVYERALIYEVLRRMDMFRDWFLDNKSHLVRVFCAEATTSWKGAQAKYARRVEECNTKTNGKYLEDMSVQIEKYVQGTKLDDEIRFMLNETASPYRTINKLRKMFAEISVDLLNPDLVIMDEFQRFRSLIQEDNSSETSVLAHKFLMGNDVKVLLLSATPYKLYSTLEEIYETGSDDPYKEFLEVMKFLQPTQHQEFKEIWSNYSLKLREIHQDKTSIIEARDTAESAMYQGVCRTERMAAIKNATLIDDTKAKQAIKINENDIIAFLEAEDLVKRISGISSVPVEYVKSCPYLLSFSKQYKFRKNIDNHFHQNQQQINQAKRKMLWIDESGIEKYKELITPNARLEMLKEIAFENKSELLLWVPPSKPYYEPQGAFKEAHNFSKILVFSAWEMVPRMIASLISYEAERRSVGKLVASNKDKKNTIYSAPNSRRFPVARLRFNIENDMPQSMSLFCLLYPSQTLAEIYNPISHVNEGHELRVIEAELLSSIETKLSRLTDYQTNHNRVDERWYYLAPMLLDNVDYVKKWFAYGKDLISASLDEDEQKSQKGFDLHLDKLREYFSNPDAAQLGLFPDDLAQVLVRMALASPAVCAYRAYGQNAAYASQFAKAMINLFNKTEATAIIELCYVKTSDDAHWMNVLHYCRDGNLQAMLDEFIHMLTESNGLVDNENRHKAIHNLMLNTMKTHSASYTVDTYRTFKNSILKGKEKGISLRSHFAVGFYKGEGESSKIVNRKESIRNSFNSPFRPFVLATTSIGQEGLDFHYYCRKIMHWNLPSNPVDLEQREGRIDRFKCLAIRQNIAEKYAGKITFKTDVWTEMFDRAKLEYNPKYSELVPFWCLPDAQSSKIERIVPSYPLSKDIGNYERLIKILSLYRLTLGQARQEELLEHIFTNCENSDDIKELFINLSPYYREMKN
ncbi:MAG: hypothetical protein RBS43_06710 [Candidatus Cloacimonas sp.]|jgi:hypothetical protein|nr:hypothetical protein [Candidatus Cloacimonas sp.]